MRGNTNGKGPRPASYGNTNARGKNQTLDEYKNANPYWSYDDRYDAALIKESEYPNLSRPEFLKQTKLAPGFSSNYTDQLKRMLQTIKKKGIDFKKPTSDRAKAAYAKIGSSGGLALIKPKPDGFFKPKTTGKPAEVLLGKLMEHHLNAIDSGIGNVDDNAPLASSATTTAGLSFCNILHNFKMHDKNTTWRKAWKGLSEQNLILQIKPSGGFYTSAFRLTTTGLEEASTKKVKEIMAKNSDGGTWTQISKAESGNGTTAEH